MDLQCLLSGNSSQKRELQLEEIAKFSHVGPWESESAVGLAPSSASPVVGSGNTEASVRHGGCTRVYSCGYSEERLPVVLPITVGYS